VLLPGSRGDAFGEIAVHKPIRCVAAFLLMVLPAFVPMTACKGRRVPVTAPPTQSGSAAPSSETAGTAAPAVVTMLANAGEVGVGDRVHLHIVIQDAINVGSVPFHVAFDPAVLRFEQAQQGPFLSSDGRQTAFFAAATSSGDSVVVGLSRLGAGHGIAGSGELCVLQFVAVGPGNAALAFANEKVRDASNRIVPGIFQKASVTVR
jgi:hypothetical protein